MNYSKHTETVNNSIANHYEQIEKLLTVEIERLVLKAFKRNKNLKSFILLMGTYYFEDQTGEVLYDYSYKELENFMSAHEISYNQYVELINS